MRMETDNSLPIVNNDLKRNSLLLISPRLSQLSLFKKATAWHSALQNPLVAKRLVCTEVGHQSHKHGYLHTGRHFFTTCTWRVSIWTWRVDGDRHFFDWMSLISNVWKMRGSLSGDNVRLAISQWKTRWYPLITCRWRVDTSCSLQTKRANH